MGKKTKKTGLPKWLKSKWFLLGVALVVAIVVIIGYQTFAANPTTTGNSSCTKTILRRGSENRACVKYAQVRLNHYCKTSYLPWSYSVDLKVNGVFDKYMFDKVYSFQSVTGIGKDGRIGPETWNMLAKKYKGKPNQKICR